MTVKLKPHQVEAVEKLGNGKILYGGVGVGKSITAMAYYVSKVCGGTYNDFGSMTTPRDIVIITTARKRDSLDWEKEAIRFGVSTEARNSPGGVQLTVDSWNNISTYEDDVDKFFVFDEQRLVGRGAWVKSFYKIAKSNQWILLSATPGDTWLDYAPVFIGNGWYKNITEFRTRHVIYNTRTKFPKVDRYVDTGRLVKLRNHILVEMPYERHTIRHIETRRVAYDLELFERVYKKRWHVYEERPLKDVAEMFSVMRKVVNSDSSRLEQLEELLQMHPRVIVFYNFDYELENLKSRFVSDWSPTTTEPSPDSPTPTDSPMLQPMGVPTSLLQASSPSATGSTSTSSSGSGTSFDPGSLVVAEWNGHKHQSVPDSERWLYLVQYQAGAEAWNCITTNAICFFSQTYSYKMYHQAHGRIDRLDTPYTDLYYYNLLSTSFIDLAIRKSLNAKESFNEARFARSLGKTGK